MQEKSSSKFSNVLKLAGAFAAFIMGSGYQSGQEIIQFFSSYGYLGILGGFISMFLFAWSALACMSYGFKNKQNAEQIGKHPFDHWFVFQNNKESAAYKVGKAVSVFLNISFQSSFLEL